VDGFSELEQAFFREGDQLSEAAEHGVVVAEVIELSSRAIAPTDLDYYASMALTVEADTCSGGFEAAA